MDKRVEVVIEAKINYAGLNHDWEATVTNEVKVEADMGVLLSIPLEELCRSLAYRALIEFRANEVEKEVENGGID